jgi:aminoglycoside phosphotransferase (APT) family kinase protein
MPAYAPPDQARWIRAEPRRSLPAEVMKQLLQGPLFGSRVLAAEPAGDGLRNSNFKLHLDPSPEPLLLRLYEHDASLCQKEIDVMRLVGGSVPVPEVVYSQSDGGPDSPPFALLRWIDGVSFRDLKRGGDADAIAGAAYAAGETLAAIGRFTFPNPGWIGPGPMAGPPLLEGSDPLPRFVDLCLVSQNLRERMPPALRDRTHTLIWWWAQRLAPLNRDTCLVHGDFSRRNLLLRCIAGKWRVAAVLDWEFAVSGCPLADLGSFLCYERAARPLAEPHFSTGYTRAGGKLPHDWRRLARLVELAAICESLSRDQIPEAFIPELVELVRTIIEEPWTSTT